MSRCKSVIPFAVVLLTVPASAARRPSFSLEYSAWKATHIVLTTEGPTIDGRLEIIESWKGDLAPGSPLTIPALAAFANEGKREVQWHGPRDLPEPYVRSVTGARILLFLIRTNAPPPAAVPGSAPNPWQAASEYGPQEFSTSVAWIERGEAYVYKQITNPGPSQLVHDGSALEMKIRITCLTTIRAELDLALRENDPVRVTQVFYACLHNHLFTGASESIGALETMGSRSLPVLRSLVRDIEVYPWYPNVIAALAQAGGRAASGDIVRVIQEELSYWSEEAPHLKEGWWNAEPAGQRELRRLHYGRLLQALRSLPTPVSASDRPILVKTHELWQTTAALGSVGDGQIAAACKALLEESSQQHE